MSFYPYRFGLNVLAQDCSVPHVSSFGPQLAQQRVALLRQFPSRVPLVCSQGIIPMWLAALLPLAKRLGPPRNTSFADAVTGPTPGCIRIRAWGTGLVLSPLGPAPGSAAATARTSSAVRPACDSRGEAETRPAVFSAQLDSSDLGAIHPPPAESAPVEIKPASR
jgi:hypothetical protein